MNMSLRFLLMGLVAGGFAIFSLFASDAAFPIMDEEAYQAMPSRVWHTEPESALDLSFASSTVYDTTHIAFSQKISGC